MLSTAEARIYLANQRGTSQLEKFRSYYTFNFGSYHEPHRESFGRLTTLNDETIKAGTTLSYSLDHDSIVILIPLVGDLVHRIQSSGPELVEVGQVFMSYMAQGEMLHIANPYEIELISFIHIRISATHKSDLHRITPIDIANKPNRLLGVSSAQHNVRLSIGKFDGRVETTMSLLDSAKGTFAFVIDGAFELENRLLQSRDGLAIWNASQIELESLSNDAIILFIEAN